MPTGESAELEISIPYDTLVDLISSKELFTFNKGSIFHDVPDPGQDKKPRSIHEEAVALLPAGLQGFVIYDRQRSYKVDLPKGW